LGNLHEFGDRTTQQVIRFNEIISIQAASEFLLKQLLGNF